MQPHEENLYEIYLERYTTYRTGKAFEVGSADAIDRKWRTVTGVSVAVAVSLAAHDAATASAPRYAGDLIGTIAAMATWPPKDEPKPAA